MLRSVNSSDNFVMCEKLRIGNMKIFWQILGNSINIPMLQLVAVLTLAIVFFSVYYDFETSLILHMSFSSVGLILLTSEAIMIMANKQFCGSLTENQNAIIHGLLISFGLSLTIAGTIIISNNKTWNNETHYDTVHGLTGLMSMLFLIISFIFGIMSLVSKYLIRCHILNMSVDTLKWFLLPHHIFGSLGYAIGMGSLCYGTSSKEFSSKIQYEIKLTCVILTIVVAVWTMICTFVELCRLLTGLVRMYEDSNQYEITRVMEETMGEYSGRKQSRVIQDIDQQEEGSIEDKR